MIVRNFHIRTGEYFIPLFIKSDLFHENKINDVTSMYINPESTPIKGIGCVIFSRNNRLIYVHISVFPVWNSNLVNTEPH